MRISRLFLSLSDRPLKRVVFVFWFDNLAVDKELLCLGETLNTLPLLSLPSLLLSLVAWRAALSLLKYRLRLRLALLLLLRLLRLIHQVVKNLLKRRTALLAWTLLLTRHIHVLILMLNILCKSMLLLLSCLFALS